MGQDVADDLVVGDRGRTVEDEHAATGDRVRRLRTREFAEQAGAARDPEALQPVGRRRPGAVDHRRADQIDLARHAGRRRARDAGAVDRRDGRPVGGDDADAGEHAQRFVVGAGTDEHRAAARVLDRADRVLDRAEGVQLGSRSGAGTGVVIDPDRRLGDERAGRTQHHDGHRGRQQQGGPWIQDVSTNRSAVYACALKGGFPFVPWPSSYTDGWTSRQSTKG